MSIPFVIGISGSIGSGKSLIRHFLAMRGVLPIDADEISHLLLAKEKAGYRLVERLFGERVLAKNGEVDRKKLGEIVFKDALELKKIEAAMHPLVTDAFRSFMDEVPCPLIAWKP